MAKKSIILDNGDGRVTFSNTASVSIDDVTTNISASILSASSISLSGIGSGVTRLLSASNGTFNTFQTGTINGGAIAYDGTKWVTSNLLPNDYIGTASGDLSGTFDGDIKVINISSVSSGTLPAAFGGTGKSNLVSGQNYVLKVSSSVGATPVISAINGVSGSVMTAISGQWRSVVPGYPFVSFYTGSVGANTFTWTRPANTQYARIILQGAGGGGGGGSYSSLPSAFGGAGGGSGGFTDIIIDLKNSISASITIGIGGSGGAYFNSNTSHVASGINGGDTIFSLSDGQAYSAGGGTGGYRGNGLNGGEGGTGLTKNGGRGARGNITPTINQADATCDMSSGGGKGLGSGGTNNGAATSGGTLSTGYIINRNFLYSVDDYGNSINITVSAGASGSTSTAAPATPSGYGAGGGGGYALNATTGSPGGPGANGYALIVCW